VNQCGSSSPKPAGSTTKNIWFHFQCEGKKKSMSQLKGRMARVISYFYKMVSLFLLFRTSTEWIESTPHREGICFTQSLDVNNTHKHPQKHTKNNAGPNVCPL
jgi:hypothetical protein